MLANITTLLSRDSINVENLSSKSRGDYAYTIVDLSAPADQSVIDEVAGLENVIRCGSSSEHRRAAACAAALSH